MKSNRKVSNLFVNPRIQLPMLLFVIILGLIASGFNYYIGKNIMDSLSSVLIGVGDESIKSQLAHFVYLSVTAGLLLNLFFVIVSAIYLLMWGHRFLGAQYKLVKIVREHFLNDQFDEPVKIRESDHLKDLATALEDFRLFQKNKNS